jgi:signal peptidase II
MIFKFLSKNFYISFSIVPLIYFLDRLSKIYVIQLDKNNLGSDIFNSTYLNIVLIWNKGIAFGLLSFNEDYLYNILSIIISMISCPISYYVNKKPGLQKILVTNGNWWCIRKFTRQNFF